MTEPRDLSAADIPRLTKAAVAAGHEPEVEHVGKRFRLVCSCGFRTPLNMKRKDAFQAIGDHVARAGLAHLSGESTDTPTEMRAAVGGRA